MAYDNYSWHSGGKFPKDLPPEAGATHIAMFVAWCWLNGLAGEALSEEDEISTRARHAPRDRSLSPTTIFFRVSDGKFWNVDVNEEGNAFTCAYYTKEGGGYGLYMDDYIATLTKGLPSEYHVPDTWETFDKLASLIASRFAEFRRNRE